MDLITIIVPIYNVEQYLPSCIESILQQTYVNLQILLVDDGSTDSCPDICDEYAQKDHRVEVIHKPNGGLSDARNVGIERAKGKYITFIDSDDVIAADMVNYLYMLAENNDADISVCQNTKVKEDGVLTIKEKPLFQDYTIEGNSECVHNFMTSWHIDTVAWGKLYQKHLFKIVRYPIGLYHEDIFTTYKLIALCNKIAIGGSEKYGYRLRNNSITQLSFSPKHLDAIHGKEKVAEFIYKYYPQETYYAQANIIYSVIQCIYRIGCSNYYDKKYNHFLQHRLRNYEMIFLRYGRSRISTKILSIFAYLNVPLTIRIISSIFKLKKKILKFKQISCT